MATRLQAAKAAEITAKMQPKAKNPSEASMNMANSFEKIPRNKMALRFAKTAWIKLFF